MSAEGLPEIESVQNSEEINAIYFEWTPELVRLATSRCQIHPFWGPLTPAQEWPYYIYPSHVAFPDPADTHECLKWVGLSDEKIIQVESRFNEIYPDFQGPSCGYEEKFSSRGVNSVILPVLEKMVQEHYSMLDHLTSECEYTHEGYIKNGIQQGLSPEFAVFCGMHKDDPRCVDDPSLFEKDWFDTSVPEIITYFTTSFWHLLREFLTCKLINEGKAWSGDHGQWLIHEGENLIESKARVAGLDLKQLCERAFKEEKERGNRETRERDRQIDLEVAEAGG
ncbi:hypothetical protein N7456_005950 [Penicillium angulare]|uniref:Uncharacterized protein n=1 Tax=Penicillium angulare TaxID=116970 RepID=A0A9W9KK39_9EURO|nr:hypothetical protein N7456_005950 [Penicillium angulare]